MFAGMIGIVMVAHYGFKVNAIAAFWVAYILTRPLGASLGDYLMQPNVNGGIGLGAAFTNAVFLICIIGLVIYMTVTRQKTGERT
jgi:uncharacterized membrane-anchored protein